MERQKEIAEIPNVWAGAHSGVWTKSWGKERRKNLILLRENVVEEVML